MAILKKILLFSNLRSLYFKNLKYSSFQQITQNVVKEDNVEVSRNEKTVSQLAEYRFVFPEFLPNPKYELRNKIREKLEREDMLKRRSVINIPEFYVGSILAVTCSDPSSPGKETRFVGICIQRTFPGLMSTFVLRNVVDNQGIEIMYDMYNPNILNIDVLRLEKRLDDELLYLRDAPAEYSTFSFDIEQEFIIKGEPIRINALKVKLKSPPWCRKWEQYNLKGVDEMCFTELPVKRRLLVKKNAKPWEAYDLMKEYRRCIPEEDQVEIWQDFQAQQDKFPVRHYSWKRKLQKAKQK